MKDKEKNIHELKEKIREFCDARDWNQFHNAKDLSIALSIEASELLEHFRWKNPSEVEDLFKDKDKKENLEEELVDVLYFIIRIAQMYNIDLTDSFERKMQKNNKKYPIDKFKGSNKKYNEIVKDISSE